VRRADLKSLKKRLVGSGGHANAWRPAVVAAVSLAALAASKTPAGATPRAGAEPPVAGARSTGVTPGIDTGAWSVQYDGFAHGLLVLKMRASLSFSPTAYAGELTFHTAGMVAWMVHDIDDSHVQGQFVHGEDGDQVLDRAMPASFDSVGNLRGTDRVTRMSYRDGSPVIGTLTPDVALERSPVPPQSTAHTIDNLSAIAMLVRQVADTGRCDGNALLFDGRRLTSLTARTIGTQALSHTDRSIFAGDALRCDFQGNQLSGFKKDESEAEQRKTKFGNAWLASVLPHAPPVPVRVIFDNKVLGQVTLYLTSVQQPSASVAQNRGKASGE
jgi:hypothetical protein